MTKTCPVLRVVRKQFSSKEAEWRELFLSFLHHQREILGLGEYIQVFIEVDQLEFV